MCVGSPTAGAWSSFQRRPDDEFETDTARTSLIEALELFFESADPTEVARRLHTEVFVTRVEVAVG